MLEPETLDAEASVALTYRADRVASVTAMASGLSLLALELNRQQTATNAAGWSPPLKSVSAPSLMSFL